MWYAFAAWFTRRIFFGLMGGLKVVGAENVPKTGPVIIAPVHVSHIDPPLVGCCCPRRLRFMAKEELFKVFFLGPLIRSLGAFPVKRGEGDLGAIRLTIEELRAGHAVLMFPEGTRGDGVTLNPIQAGMAMLAKRSEALIVPIGIAGSNKMLPRGKSRLHRARVTVVFGEPLDYAKFCEGKKEREARSEFADELARRLAQLTTQAGLPVSPAESVPAESHAPSGHVKDTEQE